MKFSASTANESAETDIASENTANIANITEIYIFFKYIYNFFILDCQSFRVRAIFLSRDISRGGLHIKSIHPMAFLVASYKSP